MAPNVDSLWPIPQNCDIKSTLGDGIHGLFKHAFIQHL